MATPQEKLADALEALHALQEQGRAIIRTQDLTRVQRERLTRQGFIRPVINGWYIPARPDEAVGETTAWYASYWDFVSAYLEDRFGDAWSLSPEQSLLLHAEQWRVPDQLLVRSPRGRGQVTQLIHGSSLYDLRLPGAQDQDQAVLRSLRVYKVEAALIASGPGVYATFPMEMRAVLAGQRDFSAVLERLLNGGHSVIAGRLAGACRNIGRDREADDILETMRAAGYDVRETDPFAGRLPGFVYRRDESPASQRIRLMWQTLREDISGRFPAPAEQPVVSEDYLQAVEDLYVTDAYHSLSIEGYRVDAALIDRVRRGDWNPEANDEDRRQRDALAARGYHDAFQAVKASVARVLEGQNAGRIADQDHRGWYRQLFGPSVTAGLIPAGALAGYRNGPVYIRGSRHTPLNPDAVRDAMGTLFELLHEEVEPSVRVVLGHFVFVYIHPYLDGNGRMGRFLMNLMFASGGYPWTVIPVQQRQAYMAALEQASVDQNIGPFADFLSGLIGETPPAAPA
ncbi:Fic family protein [Brevundimonas sp. NPDC003935]|uniref:Fic family protein n=1 Tax=unclassified Brevundimonas TaxID=2622653 RepID=UPI003687E247